MLSALRLGNAGLRTLQPMRRHLLPPSEPRSSKTGSGEAPAAAAKPRYAQSPSGSRDALSAEESREECLMRPQRHAEYGDPSFLELSRSARTGGRGRLMTLGDAHRSWGGAWGSAMHGRRAVGARGTLDWVGRTMREEDDSRREGGRRRLLRSDLSHRMSTRGRRAASAESRLDPRRPAARAFHEHDRLGGFADARDEETGALLVEFNDGTDEAGAEAHGVEGGSAGSADSGDTSQDGDEEVKVAYPGVVQYLSTFPQAHAPMGRAVALFARRRGRGNTVLVSQQRRSLGQTWNMMRVCFLGRCAYCSVFAPRPYFVTHSCANKTLLVLSKYCSCKASLALSDPR